MHFIKDECRTNSDLTVPGCREYVVTPVPNRSGGMPEKEGKAGLVAKCPSRAQDMSEHLNPCGCPFP